MNGRSPILGAFERVRGQLEYNSAMRRQHYWLLIFFLAMAPIFSLAGPLTLTAASQGQSTQPTPQDRAAAQDRATPSAAPEVTVSKDVSYGRVNGADLLLDVYNPSEQIDGGRPAVILIHGGGWTSLDKSTMRGMGDFLARSGFVGFSVNYRLFHDGENPWPAQLDDVQRAVRWVRANATRYDVDPQRIGAFGHSAGAQLAALLGMEDTLDDSDPSLANYSSRVEAVVDVSGPTDFTIARGADDTAFFANFFGGDYSKHAAAWREASPVYHVAKSDAPFLIVHGTQDQNVSIAQAQELYDKLQALGALPEFLKVDDGHTFRTPEARHMLASATLAFFQHHLVAR